MYGNCILLVTVLLYSAGYHRSVCLYTHRKTTMADHEFHVDDAAEFGEKLAALVRTAHQSGVTVDGGWEVDGDDGDPDWDVVVTVVQRTGDDD